MDYTSSKNGGPLNAVPEGVGRPPCRGRHRTAPGFLPRLRDRAEQATSLLYLMRTSAYFDAARLMFLLTFYAGYAPGRSDGILDVVKSFNKIASSGVHDGLRPLRFSEPALAKQSGLSEEDLSINHKAIRDAIMAYGKICRKNGQLNQAEHHSE